MELKELVQIIKERESIVAGSITSSLVSPSFYRPMAVFTLVFFFVGTSGNDTLMFYGPTIFTQLDLVIDAKFAITLIWVAFVIGYAASSSLMARMSRVTQF